MRPRLPALLLVLACCTAPAAEGAAPDDWQASDEAYCRLFARRIHECFPQTRERTREQEVTRCLDGRSLARTIGQWNDAERQRLGRCLSTQGCDKVSACMRETPSKL